MLRRLRHGLAGCGSARENHEGHGLRNWPDFGRLLHCDRGTRRRAAVRTPPFGRRRGHYSRPEFQTESTKRFHADAVAQTELADTKKLADVSSDDFDAVFYPGGHGPMWDMPDNATSIALIEAFVKADKPVGAVCHAPVALVNVRGKDGDYLIKGKRVTGFTNAEEAAVGLTAVVPFLLEDRLKERGGIFGRADDWIPYVQVDGRLVTGQNPASSEAAAEALLKLLRAV